MTKTLNIFTGNDLGRINRTWNERYSVSIKSCILVMASSVQNWSVFFRSLPKEVAECLEKPFSLAEIECAVEGRSGDRASEPDGFPISFFQILLE